MNGIREYLLTITVAAIFCGAIRDFFRKKSAYWAIINLITGIFMAITVLSPFLNFRLDSLTDYMDHFSWEANQASAAGIEESRKERDAIIIRKTEAYILDKAAYLGADLSAQVTLSNGEPPVPQTVTIRGAVSPFLKSTLEDYISSQLGIAKENQIWNQNS